MEKNDISEKEQQLEDGYGAVYHRKYSIDIPLSSELIPQAMQSLQRDLNNCSPQLLAKFEKVKGEPDQLQVGDEFLIRISGPWDAPVRVTEVDPSGFTFVTLEGHLEAGEIKFKLSQKDSQWVSFEIESLARSKDAVVDFVYDKVPVARLAQTEMWCEYCKNFAQHIQEKLGESPTTTHKDDVKVFTERFDLESQKWEQI